MPATSVTSMPTVLLLAGILAAEGVSFVLVGSGALLLRGEPIAVGDVDVVIEPESTNIGRLVAALGQVVGVGVSVAAADDAWRLRRAFKG